MQLKTCDVLIGDVWFYTHRSDRPGSCSSSLNNIPLVPKLRLPLPWRHFVRLPRSTCDFVLTIVCIFTPSVCTTFEIISCFSEMTLRVLVFFIFLTEVSCQTSCLDLQLQTAWANHHLRRCFFQLFCIVNSS